MNYYWSNVTWRNETENSIGLLSHYDPKAYRYMSVRDTPSGRGERSEGVTEGGLELVTLRTERMQTARRSHSALRHNRYTRLYIT